MPARLGKLLIVLLALVGLTSIFGAVWLMRGGIGARGTPAAVETAVARRLRAMAMSRARDRSNPVPPGDEAVADGLAHFADHCATCHANDGSGDTPAGRGLYPRPPDMRLNATQKLTDGELFYIIENGVRFTGMPAWGDGTSESEAASWRLVHFIRRLPKLTDAELQAMKHLNPKGPEEWREEEEVRRFLEQGIAPASKPTEASKPTPHRHKH